MEKAKAQQPVFFGALESLRGIAALVVVIYHLPRWYDPFYDIAFIRSGHLMVDFFFVLSGFVLFHSYGRRLNGRVDLEKFVALRFGRLYPIHLTFMVAFVIIELGKYWAANKYGFDGQGVRPTLYPIVHATIENLVLVQGLGFTHRELFLNFPSWSISTEFYTYLVFGLAIWLLPRRAFNGFAVAFVGACIAVLVIGGARLGELAGFLRCLAGFFLGCLVYVVYDRSKEQGPKRDVAGVLLLLVALVLGLRSPVEDPGNVWENLAFPISAVLILALVSSPGSVTNTILLWRPFRWLGEISYSLYMSHALTLYLARHGWPVILRKFGGAGLEEGKQVSLGTASCIYPITVLAALALGWLAFKLIEDPSRRVVKAKVTAWFARPARPVLP